MTFLLVATLAAVLGVAWGERRLRDPGPLAADKILYIAPGTDLPEIIGLLEREGVIDSPILLNGVLVLEGSRSKVKAGEYLFKQNTSLRAVIDTLVNGRQVLHAITIPEGLTSEQIVARLLESDVLAGEIMDIPKEGSLLPETYKVARGTPRSDLLKKMQDDQKRIVDQVWARRTGDLPLRSPYELVTLASIVEKETGRADERSRVAGVFLNRLQKRMRLQSDPTIVYGLVGGKGTLGRGITRSELEKPTPYNTYTIDGLPPGPIANPGRAALDAVANPSRTKDLYFVADGTGGHVFAETLDQHARNVQRWRLIEKETKDRVDTAPHDVDRSAPQSVPPAGATRGERRGALEGPSIYGSLPKSVRGGFEAPGAPRPAFSWFTAAEGIAQVAPLPGAATRAEMIAGISASAFGPPGALSMGPSLEELGLTVRGVSDPFSSPASVPLLDGPVDSADISRKSNLAALPAAAETADRRDVGSGRATLPAEADDLSVSAWREPDMADTQFPTMPENGSIKRPRIYDASEGTKFDPLRDKTYDLNYPKTVPAMAKK